MQNIHLDLPEYANEAGESKEPQLMFIYPAKSMLTEFPRLKARPLEIDGKTYIAFDHANVFVNSETGKVAYSKESGDTTYFIRVKGNVYARCGMVGYCVNNVYFKNRLKALAPDVAEKSIEKALDILSDMDGWNRARKDEISASAQDRASKHAQAKQKEEEKRQKLHDDARYAFKRGDAIQFGDFENLCAEYGVDLPIQTIGAGRKAITWIKHGSMGIRGKSSPDKALLCAARLFDAMNMRTIKG